MHYIFFSVLFFIVLNFTDSMQLEAKYPLSSRFSEKANEPWGVDADLTKPQQNTSPAAYPFPSRVCQSMIRFFQVYISPIDGPRSSFIPTSSQYALLAIQKHGVFKGIAMGCDRLMRENDDNWVYRTIPFDGKERKYDIPR